WLWDRTTLRLRRQFSADNWLTCVQFSPDSRTICTSNRQSPTVLWDATTGNSTGIQLGPSKRAAWSASFSPDGRKVLTGSDPGAELWDRDTGQLLRAWTGGGSMNEAFFFPDGSKVLLLTHGFAHVWDLRTGQVAALPRLRPEGGIRRIAFSPDGRS